MLYPFIRSLLFRLDPEVTHDLSLKLLRRPVKGRAIFSRLFHQQLPEKSVNCMGLTFPNPIGLAAGLDKNGECIDAFAAMGFGFIEVGTITPLPQSGNEKPRLFRLPLAQAIINRMGFNNNGIDQLIHNIRQSEYRGILGINIGKNKNTPVEYGKDDYLICMDKAYDSASYITVNISSPNTPGLRNLQYGEALDDLLKSIKIKQQQLANLHKKYVPVAVKIAPDLSKTELIQVADTLVRYHVDAVIATNTTVDRSLVQGLPYADEMGGLSGRPLQMKSTEIIKCLKQELNNRIPIIGVGGIDSLSAAREKLAAGSTLLQLYSGLIYQGPELVKLLVKNI